MNERNDDFIEFLCTHIIDKNTLKIKELNEENRAYLLALFDECWITTQNKSKREIMKQMHEIIVNSHGLDQLKQKNQIEILSVFLYHYEQLFEKSNSLRPSKYELTILFMTFEFNATIIHFLVNSYKHFFKDIAFVDSSDFIVDWLSEGQLAILNTNIEKVNTYYKIGLMKQHLYPKKIDYYSKEVFEETGHNSKNVKPIKGLGLEFVFGSKSFTPPKLSSE